MTEKCQRCREDGEDRRTLVMQCLYEMNELGIPFVRQDGAYTLLVCKECRGSWMGAIKNWFNLVEPARESPGTGIYVREYGRSIEISKEEWQRRRCVDSAGDPGSTSDHIADADKMVTPSTPASNPGETDKRREALEELADTVTLVASESKDRAEKNAAYRIAEKLYALVDAPSRPASSAGPHYSVPAFTDKACPECSGTGLVDVDAPVRETPASSAGPTTASNAWSSLSKEFWCRDCGERELTSLSVECPSCGSDHVVRLHKERETTPAAAAVSSLATRTVEQYSKEIPDEDWHAEQSAFAAEGWTCHIAYPVQREGRTIHVTHWQRPVAAIVSAPPSVPAPSASTSEYEALQEQLRCAHILVRNRDGIIDRLQARNASASTLTAEQRDAVKAWRDFPVLMQDELLSLLSRRLRNTQTTSIFVEAESAALALLRAFARELAADGEAKP